MGFAEDKFFDFVRSNLSIMKCINVDEMLDHLRHILTLSTAEQLERDLDRRGNIRTVYHFLMELRGRDNWVNHFLAALWECEHRELFYTLQAEYRSYRPRTVWEPTSHSLPPLPHNHNDLPQPDILQRCVSLPIIPEPQPGPPVAPSPSRAQPEEVSRLSHQPQDSSDPSTLSRAPTSQSPPPAQASACPPVSLPDQVDTGKSRDDIYKAPVPESTPFQPAQFSESDGALSEATTPSEQYSSEAYFLPAKRDTTTTQPLQENSKNRAVVYPVEQSISVGAVNKIPRKSVYPEAAERDAPNPSNSSTSSMHRVNTASMEPLQRDLPGYSQGTPNSSAGQCSDANDTSQRRPVESVPNRVTSSPSQHLPVVSSGSGANAGAGQQRREQSTYQPNQQASSCRPTDDDPNWRLGKPGVLMFTDVAEATGETNECAPLSRMPILEISLDESSHGRSRSSDSSQSPAMRTGTGSPSPQGEATTSTPKKANSWSSPKRSPVENDETRVVSSSAHGSATNASLSHEPEENSFELSRDLDYYRIQYNEAPSVDDMAENRVPQHRTMNSSGTSETRVPQHRTMNSSGTSETRVPQHRTMNSSGTSETSDRETSPEKERPRETNLHNPLVITLSAAVVCLALYIIWLKHRN